METQVKNWRPERYHKESVSESYTTGVNVMEILEDVMAEYRRHLAKWPPKIFGRKIPWFGLNTLTEALYWYSQLCGKFEEQECIQNGEVFIRYKLEDEDEWYGTVFYNFLSKHYPALHITKLIQEIYDYEASRFSQNEKRLLQILINLAPLSDLDSVRYEASCFLNGPRFKEQKTPDGYLEQAKEALSTIKPYLGTFYDDWAALIRNFVRPSKQDVCGILLELADLFYIAGRMASRVHFGHHTPTVLVLPIMRYRVFIVSESLRRAAFEWFREIFGITDEEIMQVYNEK